MGAKENITQKTVQTNCKLSDWFKKEFNTNSVSLFGKLLTKKDIKVNGKRVNKDCDLNVGDNIEIFCAPSLLLGYKKIEIGYEDENIVIVNKPAELEVEGEKSLTEMLSYQLNKNVLPAHRLDRNTIGLVIFAKTEEVLNLLIDATKNDEINKYYLAWVVGIVKKKQAKETAYLFKDSKKSISLISNVKKTGYVKIETEYNLVKTDYNCSLLKIIIHNGKTHQIRAHMAYLGYPLVGDGKYGKDRSRKYQQLFAYKITFKLKENNKLSYLNNCKFEIKNAKFS